MNINLYYYYKFQKIHIKKSMKKKAKLERKQNKIKLGATRPYPFWKGLRAWALIFLFGNRVDGVHPMNFLKKKVSRWWIVYFTLDSDYYDNHQIVVEGFWPEKPFYNIVLIKKTPIKYSKHFDKLICDFKQPITLFKNPKSIWNKTNSWARIYYLWQS